MLLDRHVESLAGLDQCSETQGLSGREIAVLRLLADGGTACSIGTQLGISPRTVQKHLERIYRKLGVTDRVRAVREGEKMGVVPPVGGPGGMHSASAGR
jgi:DNA-binding NarL/FixJ family response regulator